MSRALKENYVLFDRNTKAFVYAIRPMPSSACWTSTTSATATAPA